MFFVYVIQLPWNWSPRILAFANYEKARETCDALNLEAKIGASSPARPFEILEMSILEDEDLKIVKQEKH